MDAIKEAMIRDDDGRGPEANRPMSEQQKCEPDYTTMEDGDLLEALGDRGDRWAAAFCQIAKKHGHDIDEGWMTGWFANAIEHSWGVRISRSLPSTMPVVETTMCRL